MSTTVLGRLKWKGTRDDEGHREYTLVSLVEATDWNDGPAVVMNTPGLPVPGSPWTYGNDNDWWAFCYPTIKVSPIVDDEKNYYWTAEQKFSTKPLNRCQDQDIENPLLEPQKVSGSFVEFTQQTIKDRNGKLIKSSSHELITGIEKDDARPSVTIEQNMSVLGLDLMASMIQTVNDRALWGLPKRTIKLSRASWTRNLYGMCYFYYTRVFEFDIKYNTWDRGDIVDAGYKKYGGAGSRTDPDNFEVAKDKNDENTPKKILLDGNGDPLTDPESPVYIGPVELYGESNFLVLGIPSFF